MGINKNEFEKLKVTVFPNPASDLIAIQFNDLIKYDFDIALYNINGKRIKQSKINKGQTIAYFDIGRGRLNLFGKNFFFHYDETIEPPEKNNPLLKND